MLFMALITPTRLLYHFSCFWRDKKYFNVLMIMVKPFLIIKKDKYKTPDGTFNFSKCRQGFYICLIILYTHFPEDDRFSRPGELKTLEEFM